MNLGGDPAIGRSQGGNPESERVGACWNPSGLAAHHCGIGQQLIGDWGSRGFGARLRRSGLGCRFRRTSFLLHSKGATRPSGFECIEPLGRPFETFVDLPRDIDVGFEREHYVHIRELIHQAQGFGQTDQCCILNRRAGEWPLWRRWQGSDPIGGLRIVVEFHQKGNPSFRLSATTRLPRPRLSLRFRQPSRFRFGASSIDGCGGLSRFLAAH